MPVFIKRHKKYHEESKNELEIGRKYKKEVSRLKDFEDKYTKLRRDFGKRLNNALGEVKVENEQLKRENNLLISENENLKAENAMAKYAVEFLSKLKNKMGSKFESFKNDLFPKSSHKHTTENPKIKLQLNGPINIVTNAFKQMMVNIKPNGKPYIQYKIKDIAQFICDNFVDEHGQPLSQATIQTYLSPNRTDKDPNNDIKVRF